MREAVVWGQGGETEAKTGRRRMKEGEIHVVRYTRLISVEKDSCPWIERRWRNRGGDGGLNGKNEIEDRQRREGRVCLFLFPCDRWLTNLVKSGWSVRLRVCAGRQCPFSPTVPFTLSCAPTKSNTLTPSFGGGADKMLDVCLVF